MLVDGVEPADLQQEKWAPTGLGDTVALTAGGAEREQLDNLATDCVMALQPTLKRVRASAVKRRLAAILGEFNETVLKDAAEQLKPDGQWSDPHLARNVAEALIAAAESDAPRPGRPGDGLPAEARRDPSRACCRAHYMVLPFTWVDSEVAAKIPEAVASRLHIGLGLRAVDAQRAYVIRSEAIWPPGPWHAVDPASDTEYTNVIPDLEARLARLAAGRRDIALVTIVCHDGIDARLIEIIEGLIGHLEDVRVVLLVGDLDEADVPQPVRDRIVLLRPSLAADEEQKGLNHLTEGRNSLWERHNEDRVGRGVAEVPFPW